MTWQHPESPLEVGARTALLSAGGGGAGEALLAARYAAWAAALQSCVHSLLTGACAMFYCVSPQVTAGPFGGDLANTYHTVCVTIDASRQCPRPNPDRTRPALQSSLTLILTSHLACMNSLETLTLHPVSLLH
jgi:hypothetical protein